MSDTETPSSSEEDKDQILVKMHEVTNLDIDVCNSLLDEAEWDLQLAILNHFRRPDEAPHFISTAPENPQSPSPPETSTMSSVYLIPQYMWNKFLLLTRLVAAWYQHSLQTTSTSALSPSRLVLNMIQLCVESSRLIGQLLWSLAFTEEPIQQQGTAVDDELVPYGDPEDDVIQFVAEFNEKYGHHIPNFYHAPLRKAKQMCAQNTKYLLLYIHDNNSLECDRFSINVLCDAEAIEFIDENFIIWACGCTSYESVEVLRAEHSRRCPFIAVYVPQVGQMVLCGRISSCNAPDAFIDRLSEIMNATEPLIAQEIERVNRLAESQLLREEQDANYLRSLQADQEKVCKCNLASYKDVEFLCERKWLLIRPIHEPIDLEQREHTKARRKEEEKKQRDLEMKQQQLELQEMKLLQLNAVNELASQIEPSLSNPNVIILSFRLPKGTCLKRRFLTSDTVKVMYTYMRSHADMPVNFHVYTNFPKILILEVRKQLLSCADDACLAAVGLSVSQSLLVQDLDS